MKIAMVAAPLYPLPTSKKMTWAPGVAITNLITALVEAGHEVRVYSAADSDLPKGWEHVHFDMKAFENYVSGRDTSQDRTTQQLYMGIFMQKTADHLRDNPVDVIHIHDHKFFPYFELAKLPFPVICSLHGDFLLNLDQPAPAVRDLIGRVNIATLTPVTESGELKEPVGYIPNTAKFDEARFISKPQPRLVYAGRITALKGADLLFDVAKLSPVKVDVYGAQFLDPKFKSEFLAKAEKAKNLTYHGYVPHAEGSDFFDATASLLLGREPEGLPLAILESWSKGTPVIATNSGTAIDWLVEDGVNGYKIDPSDQDSLRHALSRIGQIDRRKCFETAKARFGHQAVAKQAEKVYEQIIKQFHAD